VKVVSVARSKKHALTRRFGMDSKVCDNLRFPELFRRKLNNDFAHGVLTMAGQIAYEPSEDFQK
jgi:hypothetical protein